ncbi:MAG: DUF1987 domain-containing protein [Crocinitomicaceae bacterium]|nr:DUF1987 domain-containing protein [Crocinitomicaceae bacterium]MBK8927176.1 DUF1987 domain-containing protein [Crocinitomicaceae bacterium]
MENFRLEGTPKSPRVDFNASNGQLIISGRSIPENAREFYRPLIDWIEHYGHNPKPNTVFDVCLEYFNTSSSKALFDLFKTAEEIQLNGKSNVVVRWKYENDDWEMRDAGLEYSRIIQIPLEMIEIEV